MKIEGRIGFGILNIEKNGEGYLGQIQLVNDIKLLYKGKEKGTIHISMIGLFKGNVKLGKEKFTEMLQYNGAHVLSHLIRAYVYSATGLAGIPAVLTPMINFANFFEEAEK